MKSNCSFFFFFFFSMMDWFKIVFLFTHVYMLIFHGFVSKRIHQSGNMRVRHVRNYSHSLRRWISRSDPIQTEEAVLRLPSLPDCNKSIQKAGANDFLYDSWASKKKNIIL
ncbi:hypothetical protein Pfo_006224, partial [Paulownia fortunei]